MRQFLPHRQNEAGAAQGQPRAYQIPPLMTTLSTHTPAI